MRKICVLLIATSLACHAFAQSPLPIDGTFPVKSIQSKDEDFSDLLFLKEVLKDKRVILLGEQTHGDGATFDAKVRLIRFLHKEMGFDMLSFESDLLDGYRAWQQVKKTTYQESPLRESIYRIWSESKEVEPLIKYVHEQAKTARPLLVTGFDCQGSALLREEFLSEIMKVTGNTLRLSAEEKTSVEQVLEGGVEFLVDSKSDSVVFFTAAAKITAALKKSIAADSTEAKSIVRQSFAGWLEMKKWEIDEGKGRKVNVQNPRDLQMAHNLIYLSKLYPSKKIIGWGASYHFANRIELLEDTPLVGIFSQRMDSILQTHESTDVIKDLEGAIPMGRILKQHFGNALYSLAFSSFDGTFGMLGMEARSLQGIEPPEGSIERDLVKKNLPLAVVNFNKSVDTKFYSSALGNLPLFGPWQQIFDGLFFIKTSYPPSFPVNAVSQQNTPLVSRKVNYGSSNTILVTNLETGEGIAYANISLLNTSKGVTTNAAGEFVFTIPDAKPTDLVVLSSIGYETDTVQVADLARRKEIKLTPKTYELAALEVRAKPLTAKEIIKLAEKNISKNYYQDVHQQEFFYRVSNYREDSLTFNEEAAVLVHDPDGYKPTGNVTKNLKGEILQFRNTTQNPDKDAWAGTGSLWLMYTHDAVMDKDNALHRSSYYDLTLLGVTAYEDKRVYEIAFECKRPGAFTTGFGYPAPLQATGKIYIEVGTYAVLRMETLILRKPYHLKKRPHVVQDPYGHQLIQTYRQVNGKYFLNYSRQVHFGRWRDVHAGWQYRDISVRELLSTEISLKPEKQMTRSLSNIKSVPVKEDAAFWSSHNVVVQDNVAELLKLIEE